MKTIIIVLTAILTLALALTGYVIGAPAPANAEDSPRYPEGESPEICKEAEDALGEKDHTAAKFRIDERTGQRQAVKINSTGPCGPNMIFVEVEGSQTFGTCDCDRKKSKRFLIYHQENHQCYFIFDKAYCNAGEWLTLNKQFEPTCEVNPCTTELRDDPESDFVYLQGEDDLKPECREIGTQADYCEPGKVLGFTSGYILPQCVKSSVQHSAMPSEDVTFTCPLGTTRSQGNMCFRDADFP